MAGDPAPNADTSMRSWLLRMFPWLARVGIVASGALGIRSMAKRTEIEGPDGLLPAARKGDSIDGGGLAFYPGVPGVTPPALFYTQSQEAPYTWVTLASVSGIGPLVTDPGTRVAGYITSGSQKVKVG